MDDLEQIARELRFQLVEFSHRFHIMHLAGSLSCVDILTALYWHVLQIDPKHPEAPDRDRCILSKGHAAMTLYCTLAKKGFFPETLLDTVSQPGSALAEHPGVGCVPGVELATGSLGHGLSVGIGMAISARLSKHNGRVFVVMSDGECDEGSVWEAALFAPKHRVGRLCAIIDFNKWQATGRSTEIMQLEPLADKWRSFGWHAEEVDGHNIASLCSALSKVNADGDVPTAIICHSVKGKGVSFMEDDNNWHYRIPSAGEVKVAKAELLGEIE